MQKKIFSTFKEASNFAKQRAQEIGATVKLKREGNHWAVFTGQGGATPASGNHGHHIPLYSRQQHPPKNNRWEHHLEEQHKREAQEQKLREAQEQKRRELVQKAQEAEMREREKRRLYLKERESYYRSLPERELEKHWNQREEMDLEPDETALLRAIVREVKGIKPVYVKVQVCRQCGMVGDNCTCER